MADQSPMNNADKIELDVIGLNCPLPVLKARQAIRRLKIGETIVIKATDPLSAIDIPHFCQEDGHTLLSAETDQEILTFVVVKGKSD